MADYLPRTALRGTMSGICPTCGNMIYRAASLAKIERASGGLAIAYRKAK
jgi:hypothetical protein